MVAHIVESFRKPVLIINAYWKGQINCDNVQIVVLCCVASSNNILYMKPLAVSVPAVGCWCFSAVSKPWIGNGAFLISLSREITFSSGAVGGRFPQYGTLTGTIFHFSNKNEWGILFVKTFVVNIRHKRGNVGSTDTDLSLSLSLSVVFYWWFINCLCCSFSATEWWSWKGMEGYSINLF